MLKMIKNLAHTARATKFAGQSPVLSGKVISMTQTLGQIGGGVPRLVPERPKDKV